MCNKCCDCSFDLERMKKSLESDVVLIPNGLTREQMRQHMIDTAKQVRENEGLLTKEVNHEL